VSELVTNSVRHGRLADDAVISLHIESRPDAVRVEVTNPGDGFLPPDRALTLDQESGWGLFLVDELADRWGIDADGGTHVWFEIDR
jgi:anti-sigma regulatory factor (Ser/Thr protein kinase)